MPGDGMRGGFEPPAEDFRQPFGPKKKIALVLAGCGLVLLAILGRLGIINPPFGIPFPRGLDIGLSEPELDETNGNRPIGFFGVEFALFGIDSDQTGGACLVADIASMVSPAVANDKGIVGGSCTSDEQCMKYCANEPLCDPKAPADPSNPTKPANPLLPRQKWWGYCAPDPDNAHRRCWYKPDLGDEKQLCEKSLYYADPNVPGSKAKVWDIDVQNKMPHVENTSPPGAGFDVKAFYHDFTSDKPARWRLVGRLNSKNGPPRIRYGEPSCLPKPTPALPNGQCQ